MTNEERDKTIKILQWLHDNNFLFRTTEEDVKYATKLAIRELQQVPFMNKPCVAHQVCHEDKVKVLDKIRAEIDERKKNSGGEPNRDIAFNVCLQIIDKYKGESEVQE